MRSAPGPHRESLLVARPHPRDLENYHNGSEVQLSFITQFSSRLLALSRHAQSLQDRVSAWVCSDSYIEIDGASCDRFWLAIASAKTRYSASRDGGARSPSAKRAA